MKLLLAASFALLAGCAGRPCAQALPVVLVFQGGSCSGTVISGHAILTATHCMGGAVSADGIPLSVIARLDDGNDHTILIVRQAFDALASFAPMPSPGSPVHIHGNPAVFRGIYAIGAVAGPGSNGDTLLDIRLFLGDSGAAVMDGQGRIVGVISGVLALAGKGITAEWGVAKPLKFTAMQWREAGVTP